MFFGFDRVVPHVVAIDCHLAVCRFQYATDDIHNGGLPGSVGAQQPVNTALTDGEINVFDCPLNAVFVRKILYFDNGFCHFDIV